MGNYHKTKLIVGVAILVVAGMCYAVISLTPGNFPRYLTNQTTKNSSRFIFAFHLILSGLSAWYLPGYLSKWNDYAQAASEFSMLPYLVSVLTLGVSFVLIGFVLDLFFRKFHDRP